MSNSKRFLSVILAMVMAFSTLVVGANAAYTAYKDSAIVGQYNDLDTAVLSTEQYASAAMDEVDRMLNKEQLKFTRADIVVGDVDLTSIDAAMDSVYALATGRLWQTFSGMLGDLSALNVSAFRTVAEGGVRRSTSGKTDLDIIYAVLQLLYDNKNLVVKFVNGNLDMGSIVSSLVDISAYTDVNKLLKGLLYKATYEEDAPADVSSLSIDTMVQDIIDKYVIPLVPALEGHTNISSGSAYNFVDSALKILYNELLVPLLNENVNYELRKACGVVFTKNEAGEIIDEDRSNLNAYASLLNIDYVVPTYTFTSGTLIDNLNNIIKSILDVMVSSSVFTWAAGDNSMLLTNVTNLAKAVLCNTGDDFFASYIDVATPEEVNAMDTEELVVYALRAIINGSVHGMYIPDSATTLREFGYYALGQLLATSVPELDFSSFDKNSTDTLVIMGIDYAIYSVNAVLDMGLSYVTTMTGVDQQIKIAVNYAIDNYGGLLNGITFNTSASGWDNLNTLIFAIIPSNWLPTAANADVKTLIIDCLIDNILNLDFDAILDMLVYRSDSELQKTPKQVVINLVSRIVNIIFPGAIGAATSFDALATNSALAGTVGKIFDCLNTYKTDLVAAVLPTLCNVLSLTSPQEFKFPEITCDDLIFDASGAPDYSIKIRNGSTGINTGYTDANGVFHQDSLYTYDIQSVTTNVSGINVTNPGTLAGGQEGTIRVTGSFTTDSVFIVTITYDVLTEDGTPLTDAPITEYIYSYLSKSDNDDKAKLTATGGDYSITDGPLNVYASSMSDLYGMQYTVENASSAQATVEAYTTALTSLTTAAYTSEPDEMGNTVTIPAGKCYLQLKEGTTTLLPKVEDNNGIAKTYLVETTEEYNALTAAEKDAVWQAMINKGTTSRNRCKYTVTSGVTINGTTTVKNTKHIICLYNDFDLGSLLSAEMGKHRQASGYSSTAAWARYTAAMEQAAKAVYSPFKASTFSSTSANTGKDILYQPAFEELTAAIEALEATTVSQGVTSTQAIIDRVSPTNEDKVYTDSDYSFFGVSDYVAYTYYNYKDELKTANNMINAATVPDETTGEVQVIDDLTLAYNNHRLSLYASRLLPVAATKAHLEKALAQSVPMADEANYSAESWDNYITAYNFATSVNGTAVSALKQSKINTAYNELLEAEKRLVADEGEEEEVVFTPVNPESATETAPVLIPTADGTLIAGIYGEEQFDADKYFTGTGYTVETEVNSLGLMSTGATIIIKNATTQEVLATYTMVVTGDLDGNSVCDSGDSSLEASYAFGLKNPTDIHIAAGDLDDSGLLDSLDSSPMTSAAMAVKTIDYANRTVV